ncbi:MAG: copper oxidase, partial [Nitrosomonas sp. PRO5]|nr:copper oxidase [Nitrosomonas sp. PRO5]
MYLIYTKRTVFMKNSISLFSSYRFTHIILMLIVLALIPLTSQAEKREFDLSIEDTRIVLVGKRDFHTFAF